MLLTACEEEISPKEPLLLNYFPFEEGMVREYQIDSILYFETLDNDTISWLVREEFGPFIVDLQGDTALRVSRFRRPDSTAAWQYLSTWLSYRNQNQAERVEDNLRFIKLTFPPKLDRSWEGHAYLGGLESEPVNESCNQLDYLEDWDFEYDQVHFSYNADWINSSFDSCIQVRQQGTDNLIQFDAGREIYANGIGLVYREHFHYTTQSICPDCPWNENVECGFSTHSYLLSWN